MAYFPIRKNKAAGNPFYEIENLHNEMDRLFGFAFPRWEVESPAVAGPWSPAIDVTDTKDNIVVKADLPGLTKEDINVSVQDDVLTISGEKKQESKEEKDNYLRTERYYGSFYRSLRLPTPIDANKVNATFKDGVLELKLAKKEEAKPKQITIDVK